MSQEPIQGTLNSSAEKVQDESFIYVKENKKVIKVYFSEIRYIEGLSEYVQIYTDKRKIITKTSMAQMEEKLSADNFLRIHKSYIVPVSKIEAFTANTIEIQGKELPIGRNFKNAVLNSLNYSGPVAGV